MASINFRPTTLFFVLLLATLAPAPSHARLSLNLADGFLLAPDTGLSAYARDVINTARRGTGLPPVCVSEKLAFAATRHVLDLQRNGVPDEGDYTAGTDGSSTGSRVADAGFRASAIRQLVLPRATGARALAWGEYDGDEQLLRVLEDNAMTTPYNYIGLDATNNFVTMILSASDPAIEPCDF